MNNNESFVCHCDKAEYKNVSPRPYNNIQYIDMSLYKYYIYLNVYKCNCVAGAAINCTNIFIWFVNDNLII